MIVTVTPNPSIDRTVDAARTAGARRCASGAVGHDRARRQGRQRRARAHPGRPGRGGRPARRRTRPDHPRAGVLRRRLPRRADATARCAPTSRSPNPMAPPPKSTSPATLLDATALDALTRAILERAAAASWVVLSGSLPPGMPHDLVCRCGRAVAALRLQGGGGHLRRTADRAGGGVRHRAAPDLIKPNAEELAGLAGVGGRDAGRRIGPRRSGTRGRRRQRLVDRGAADRAGHPRRRRRGAGQRHRQLAGHPAQIIPAAPSAPATPRSRVMCAPTSAAPRRRNDCRWRSPTAAPPRRCRVRRCRRPPRSTSRRRSRSCPFRPLPATSLNLKSHDEGVIHDERTSIISADLVLLDVDAGTDKESVIGRLAGRLADSGRVNDREALQAAAMAREAQSATGLPGGIAIPHCRSAAVQHSVDRVRPPAAGRRLRGARRARRSGLPDRRAGRRRRRNT